MRTTGVVEYFMTLLLLHKVMLEGRKKNGVKDGAMRECLMHKLLICCRAYHIKRFIRNGRHQQLG